MKPPRSLRSLPPEGALAAAGQSPLRANPLGKIRVEDVHKNFAALPVIGGVSFSVADGEFVAIVGPSGCGKSTLMNVIAGFEKPDSGAVRIDGAPMAGPSPKGIVISQHGSVFPWLTVQQNLMFGLHGAPGLRRTAAAPRGGQPDLGSGPALGLNGKRHDTNPAERAALADHYAAMVGLKGFEGHYPHELSGGMLKRVELARAFIVKPEILYLDEPFSALDALMNLRMRNELLRILDEERHTVLLITHDVDEAIYMADRILVLSPRPTTIQASFDVSLPHPRRLASPEAEELREAILKELGL